MKKEHEEEKQQATASDLPIVLLAPMLHKPDRHTPKTILAAIKTLLLN